MSTGFEKIGSDRQLQDHWIRRVVAFIVDSIIVGVATMIIALAVTIPFILTGLPWYFFNPFSFPFISGILSVLYFALLETLYGTTLGKRIMNLKTTKLDGQRPPIGLAFIRNISKIYWVIVLVDTLVGMATPGDPHQKMTDRYAGTIVTSAGSSPFIGQTPA